MNTSRLIRPVIHAEFTIRYAMERIRQLESEIKKLKTNVPLAEKYVKVLQGHSMMKVPVMDILFIKSESNYSRIYLKNGGQYFMGKTLKSWVQEITEENFIRCHRSYLVNQKEIVEINRCDNYFLISNGEHISISRAYMKNCVSRFFPNESKNKATGPKLNCTIHKLVPVSV